MNPTQLFVFFILLVSALTFPVHAQSFEWWNSGWYYRIPIEINSSIYERNNTPMEIEINFTEELKNLGLQIGFDNNSIRVLEYNSSGSVLYEVPSQFDEEIDYSQTSNAVGIVTWIINGSTPVNQKRYYFIYFDSLNNSKNIPDYQTNLSYSWDGEEFWLNNSLRAIKIDTLRGENTSGIYYATNYTITLFDAPQSEKTIEYIKLFNGTSDLMYDFRWNASFKAGPVKITITQIGEESLWNNPDSKTGKGKIIKKYTFYKDNPWVKIQQQLIANDSITRNSPQITALTLDADKAFGMDAMQGSSSDPCSEFSAYSNNNKGLGIINLYEKNTTNYYAVGSLPEGRIGIKLDSTTLNQGESVIEETIVYFNDKATHQPVIDLKDRFANPVNITKNMTENWKVAVNPQTDYNIYNKEEILIITANITEDNYNLTKFINATLNNITLVLYDDGTHNDFIAEDHIYTNIYLLPTNAETGKWNLTTKIYDSSGYLLNQNSTTFNVTDLYFANLTISNPSGTVNRIIYANLLLKNYRKDDGINGANLNCEYNSILIPNISDNGNGNYSINFTAPSEINTFNLTCNATKSQNHGFDSQLFYTESEKTSLEIDIKPKVFIADNITQNQSHIFELNVCLNNTGDGTAYSTILNFSLPVNWSISPNSETCGNLNPSANCIKYFNLTVPAKTSPGNYSINAIINWTNPDSSLNSTYDPANITILSNPILEVVESYLQSSVNEGLTTNIGNFTINSTGNDALQNISFDCIQGEVCLNFSVYSIPENISILDAGNSHKININLTIPEGYETGNYSGIINISSANGGYETLFLNISILESRTWLANPITCARTVLIDNSGLVCQIQINNTGNIPINYSITPDLMNYTLINETNFTINAQNSKLLYILYNTTNASQGTYNSSYFINATTGNSTPKNQTINITLEVVFGPTVNSLTADINEQLETIFIIANLTDRSGSAINWVKANITKPDGGMDIINLMNTTLNNLGCSSLWQYNYTNTSQRGLYEITIYSYDNAGGYGYATDSFKVYAKLNISLATGWEDYFAGQSGTIYYNITDGVGIPLVINATITLYSSLNKTKFNNSYQTNTGGTLPIIPSFQIPSDAPLGNYLLKSFTTFYDSAVNISTNQTTTHQFGVYEKYEKSFITSGFFFPNSELRFYLHLSNAYEFIEPDNITIKVIDLEPINTTLFLGTKNEFKILDSTDNSAFYEYIYDPIGELDTGLYVAEITITQGSRKTNGGTSIFRVTEGGPYDLVISDISSEVEIGKEQYFSIRLENKGELGKDIYLDYWISKDNKTYDSVESEPVFVGANSNRTVERQLHIFSDQPIGEYKLNTRLNYSTIKPVLETSRIFRVIVSTNPSEPPHSPTSSSPSTTLPLQPVLAAPVIYELQILNIFPPEFDIEKGGAGYVIIEVKNTGNRDLHSISAYFENMPEWFEIIREISILKPGSTGYLLTKFNIPRDTEPKLYSTKIKLSSKENITEKTYKIEIFESKEKLIETRIKKIKQYIFDIELRAAGIGEEGGDIAEALRLIELANDLVTYAESYLNDKKLIEATEILGEARNQLEKADYLLSIAKPVETMIIQTIPQWVYLIFAVLIVISILSILLIKFSKQKKDIKNVKKKDFQYSNLNLNIKNEEKPENDTIKINEEKNNSNLFETIEEQFRKGMISKRTYEELKKKYK